MRVALYARVSTEEQKNHGYSIDAQISALRAWSASNNHSIVGEYIDAGISGKKPYQKRPELFRFMQQIESGLKVDALVFCKLDRFYRSVKLYYQAVELLDRYHVAWQAIQEDYETVTASGRFKVNIMLSVAENEADRTSERIKAVFAHKVAKGESLGGRPLLGYKFEDKKVVPDPEKVEIARAMFRHYLDSQSYYDTARFLHAETGQSWEYHFIRRCLSNPLYIGKYRDNNNYCEGIIDRATFDAAQELMKRRSVRHSPVNRVYLFTGLTRCACCGHSITGFSLPKPGGQDYYYRCHEAALYHRCVHTHSIREERLERWLLDNVALVLDEYTAQYEIAAKKKAPDNAKIRRKLDRLKTLYLDELITLEQYKADRAALEAQIVEPVKPPDYSALQAQFTGAFRSVYKKLTREQRREFWHGVIDTIELDAENNPRISFRTPI